MFGDNPFVRDFVKEFTRNAERRTPGGFAGADFPGGGARGGAPGGVTPEQWAEMVRGVFGAEWLPAPPGTGLGGSVSVREEIVTRADGRRVVRTTTTTTTPGGTTTRVEEKVVAPAASTTTTATAAARACRTAAGCSREEETEMPSVGSLSVRGHRHPRVRGPAGTREERPVPTPSWRRRWAASAESPAASRAASWRGSRTSSRARF